MPDSQSFYLPEIHMPLVTDRSFSEVLGDLVHGNKNSDYESPSDADDSEDEGNREDPDSSAPDDVESPEEADTPEPDPTPDDEADPDEEVEDDSQETDAPDDEPEEVEGEAAEDEDDESDDTSDDEPDLPPLPEGYAWDEEGRIVAEIDGSDDPVPLEELRRGYLRQSDYTRKTQQVAAQRQQVEEALTSQRELIRDINAHQGMQEFLSEHPDAYEFLLAEPEETRKLMQSPSAFESFKQDYEVLKSNPRLAEAYLEKGDTQEAQSQLHQYRAAQQYQGFANSLDQAIDRIAEHEAYADVVSDDDVAAVKDWVMEMGGFSLDSDPQEIIAGLDRLATVFVRQGDSGPELDMGLVIDRFDSIRQRAKREQDIEEKKAEEHNKQVDAELEEQKKRTPKSPEGDGVAPEPDKTPERKDFHEVLGALRGN